MATFLPSFSSGKLFCCCYNRRPTPTPTFQTSAFFGVLLRLLTFLTSGSTSKGKGVEGKPEREGEGEGEENGRGRGRKGRNKSGIYFCPLFHIPSQPVWINFQCQNFISRLFFSLIFFAFTHLEWNAVEFGIFTVGQKNLKRNYDSSFLPHDGLDLQDPLYKQQSVNLGIIKMSSLKKLWTMPGIKHRAAGFRSTLICLLSFLNALNGTPWLSIPHDITTHSK